MLVNITGITGPQLTGLVASAGIGSVALKWDNPNNPYHKATEVWSSASSLVDSATKLATTNEFSYVVVDAGSTPMYYWVRSVSVFNRSDAPFSASVTKAGNAVTGTSAKMLSMGASSQIFSVSKAGTAAPTTISLYASAQNLQGTPTWTIISGTATLNAPSNANVYQKDLTYASMTTDQVTVQVTQDGLTDQITIVKVKDGIDTITGMLTNEASNVAADVAGNVSSFANSGGSFKVFQGTVDKTASSTFSVVSTSSVGISITTGGVYSVTSLTADNGSATLRAVYGGVTIDKIFTITKSKQGAQGPQGNTGNTGSGSPGQRGTVNLTASGYSYWSDSAAYSVISSSGYNYPIRGDIVTLYDSTHSFTYFYDGYGWSSLGAYLNGNMLISGTLSADKITTGTLSADRIYGGTIRGIGIDIAGNMTFPAGGYGGQIYTSNFTRCTASNGDAPGIPAFKSTTSGPGAALSLVGSSNGVALTYSGNGILQVGGTTNYFAHVVGNTDNAGYLGDPQHRWNQLYVTSGVINTSDARTKKDVVGSVLGLSFINDLTPVSYRQIVGQNVISTIPSNDGDQENDEVVVTPRPGVRRHYGFLAQEVRQALLKHGEDDTGIWCLDDSNDPESRQALRYEELIGPLVKAVQELSALVKAQQSQIDALIANR